MVSCSIHCKGRSMTQPSHLTLTVNAGPISDAEDSAKLGQQLRNDILELDVDSVEPVRSGTAPAGAKGDPAALGALAVTLAPAMLTSLFALLQVWLSRRDTSSITVEIGGDKVVLTGNPTEEQRDFINTMLRQHSKS